MKSSLFLVFLSLGLSLSANAAAASASKKVLFFSKSSGFIHPAIMPEDGEIAKKSKSPNGYAFPVLRELGKKNNIELTFSKDGALLTPEYLAQFDGYCFYTSGDLTEKGEDGNPPMTAAGKAALLEAIKGGKGFVGIHSASDTLHSPGGADRNSKARGTQDGDKADEYIKMLGGEFITHGKQQTLRQAVADPTFPGADGWPATSEPQEEIYALKDFAPNLHAILVVKTAGMDGDMYQRGDYPSTWARGEGKGRVFYTAMGHRDDIWTNTAFQALLVGGLNWTLGRVEADVTPNLAEVAPKANDLPPFSATPPTRKKKSAAR